MATTKLAAPPPEDPSEGTPNDPALITVSTNPETVTTTSSWGNWAYTGPDRIYTNVPITTTTGTIIHWHTDPGLGDGCWTSTTAAPNRRPDNYRPEPTEAEAAKLRGDDDDTPKEG
jgi:hypothetical protein